MTVLVDDPLIAGMTISRSLPLHESGRRLRELYPDGPRAYGVALMCDVADGGGGAPSYWGRHPPCRHSGVSSAPPEFGKGFDSEIGLTYIEVTPDEGHARLDIHDKLLQPWGIVHGGVYCSIIESLSSVCGHAWLSENGGGIVVGVNNNTDFLRAIRGGTVYAVATPVHRGRSQQLWVTTITDENDRVVARGQVRLQNLGDEPLARRAKDTDQSS